MKKYTVEELKAKFEKHNYRQFDFHFVGVRSTAELIITKII